jgi:hypothetical protein
MKYRCAQRPAARGATVPLIAAGLVCVPTHVPPPDPLALDLFAVAVVWLHPAA